MEEMLIGFMKIVSLKSIVRNQLTRLITSRAFATKTKKRSVIKLARRAEFCYLKRAKERRVRNELQKTTTLTSPWKILALNIRLQVARNAWDVKIKSWKKTFEWRKLSTTRKLALSSEVSRCGIISTALHRSVEIMVSISAETNSQDMANFHQKTKKLSRKQFSKLAEFNAMCSLLISSIYFQTNQDQRSTSKEAQGRAKRWGWHR